MFLWFRSPSRGQHKSHPGPPGFLREFWAPLPGPFHRNLCWTWWWSTPSTRGKSWTSGLGFHMGCWEVIWILKKNTNYLELPICFCLVYMVLNFWYLSWGAGRWGSHTYQENCFPQPDFYHLDCFPWWFCICCWCGKPNAINHPYVWGSWNWVCPYFSCDVSL